jgi:hypothetical protein
MQRTQKALVAGLVGGLLISLAASAPAQTYYVESPTYREVPVTHSVVVTRSFGGSSYLNSSNYSRAQAWNNRTSAPAVYSESRYLPESVAIDPISVSGVMSSRSYVASPTTIHSGRGVSYRSVISSQPVVYSEPVYVSRPAVTSRVIVAAQPEISSEPLVAPRTVRVYRSVVAAPAIAAEKVECISARVESQPKVSISTTTDGRRVKTYRYEYEIDDRPARVTIEFDPKD